MIWWGGGGRGGGGEGGRAGPSGKDIRTYGEEGKDRWRREVERGREQASERAREDGQGDLNFSTFPSPSEDRGGAGAFFIKGRESVVSSAKWIFADQYQSYSCSAVQRGSAVLQDCSSCLNHSAPAASPGQCRDEKQVGANWSWWQELNCATFTLIILQLSRFIVQFWSQYCNTPLNHK